MRKIKNLTLLALMLGSIVTIQAQEKQNDATWEETIEFLKKNIHYLNHSLDSNSSYSINIEIDQNMIIKTYAKDNVKKFARKMNLNDLSSVERGVDILHIKACGKYVTTESFESDKGRLYHYELSPYGIHSEEIDEDLSFEGFFKFQKEEAEV